MHDVKSNIINQFLLTTWESWLGGGNERVRKCVCVSVCVAACLPVYVCFFMDNLC